MKILNTCLSKSWGGMEMYALHTVRQLSGRGCEAELLCYPDSRLQQEASRSGITCHLLKVEKHPSPMRIFELRNILSNNGYDLIHSEASGDLWSIVPALKLSGLNIPLLLTKHVGSYISKKDFLHRWIYNRVDLALAISSVIKKNLLDTTPLTGERIQLLHDAIDTEKFNPSKTDNKKVRKEFNIKDDEMLIGITSRFSSGKGHEEFLRAAKELSGSFHNLKFLIVGEPSRDEDGYAAGIKELAAELGINDKVIFTGYRNDLPEILAALNLFVFPSHAEAFGLALVEAMSMELPSVCSDSDGVLDIAIDGETSLLFQKKNYSDLTDKIRRLINDPEKRRSLGLNARKRVLENFDFNHFTDRMIAIFENQIVRSALKK
ncbi:MAG: glycosyltransferase family 4 protein [Melioribacteraceae bacterium]